MSLGVTNYKGDINPNITIKNVRLGINGFFRLNFKRGLSWRYGATIGFLNGNNQASSNPLNINRKMRFSTTFVASQTLFEYHFFDFRKASSKGNFNPYVFGGVGMIFFNTNTFQNNKLIIDDVVPISAVFPFGVGIKKLFHEQSTYIAVEAMTYKTLSDKIDKVYQKGDYNTQSFDTLYYFSIQIGFIITNIRCPSPSVNF